jgi:hypothetical protein
MEDSCVHASDTSSETFENIQGFEELTENQDTLATEIATLKLQLDEKELRERELRQKLSCSQSIDSCRVKVISKLRARLKEKELKEGKFNAERELRNKVERELRSKLKDLKFKLKTERKANAPSKRSQEGKSKRLTKKLQMKLSKRIEKMSLDIEPEKRPQLQIGTKEACVEIQPQTPTMEESKGQPLSIFRSETKCFVVTRSQTRSRSAEPSTTDAFHLSEDEDEFIKQFLALFFF